MTIEEKAQAYDKALKGIEDYIKSLKNVNDGIWSARDIENHLSEIFPQFKESEDEKIRKTLINFFDGWGDKIWDSGIKYSELVAWLEKQGKHANFRNKIQIGDKVTRNDNGELVNLSQLERVAKKLEKQKPAEWSEGDEYNSAFIQEALLGFDGDDSYREKCCKMAEWIQSLKDRVGCEVNCTTTSEPVVRENKGNYGGISPNSEWSEEDERNLQGIIDEIEANKHNAPDYDLATYDRFLSWLKSLKDRVGNFDDGYKVGFSAAKHNQWKPSDEQMKAIRLARSFVTDDYFSDNPTLSEILIELENQLKKLREE